MINWTRAHQWIRRDFRVLSWWFFWQYSKLYPDLYFNRSGSIQKKNYILHNSHWLMQVIYYKGIFFAPHRLTPVLHPFTQLNARKSKNRRTAKNTNYLNYVRLASPFHLSIMLPEKLISFLYDFACPGNDPSTQNYKQQRSKKPSFHKRSPTQ